LINPIIDFRFFGDYARNNGADIAKARYILSSISERDFCVNAIENEGRTGVVPKPQRGFATKPKVASSVRLPWEIVLQKIPNLEGGCFRNKLGQP
jgi:hypothetical protein